MATLGERGPSLQRVRRLRATADDTIITDVMQEALPLPLVDLMTPAERLRLRDRIAQLPEPPLYAKLTLQDLKGAAGVFL